MWSVTYDQTNLRSYDDDAEATGSPDAATFALGYIGTPSLYLANLDGNSARAFDGALAGVAIFPSALSSTNISDLYDAVTT
jgi:hypothetical protein